MMKSISNVILLMFVLGSNCLYAGIIVRFMCYASHDKNDLYPDARPLNVDYMSIKQSDSTYIKEKIKEIDDDYLNFKITSTKRGIVIPVYFKFWNDSVDVEINLFSRVMNKKIEIYYEIMNYHKVREILFDDSLMINGDDFLKCFDSYVENEVAEHFFKNRRSYFIFWGRDHRH